MQTFDDLSPVEMDPQNEDVIVFLSQVHDQAAGAEPTPEQTSQALARVRQRLLTARQELREVEDEPERVPERVLHLLNTNHGSEEISLARVGSVLPVRKRGWQRRFSLLAASLALMLVVGSMLAVFSLARPGQAGTGQQAVYAFTGGWLQKFDAQTGALLWKVQTPFSNKLSPGVMTAASNGLVYIVAQQKLFAFKESDGSLLWNVNMDGVGLYKPIVDHTRLYIMLWKDTSKYDNHTSLTAFDALSGQQLWHYDRNGLFPNFAVANDTVYSGLDLNPPPTNNNFHANFDLFALHATDGSEAWRVHIDNPSLRTAGEIFAVAGGKLYIKANATATSYLYAYNASNGAFMWRSSALPYGNPPIIAVPYTDSPLVLNQRIYVFNAGAISALDERNGHLLWEHAAGFLEQMGVSVDASYALVGNTIFSGETHSDGDYIVALNALTGQVTSQHRISVLNPPLAPTSTVVGQWQVFKVTPEMFKFAIQFVGATTTYAVDSGHLLAFSNATGKQLWSAQLVSTPATPVSITLSE